MRLHGKAPCIQGAFFFSCTCYTPGAMTISGGETEMAKGSLEVIVGCISSGKSEELIRLLRRAMIARQSVRMFKPIRDTRNNGIESRDGRRLDAIGVHSSEEVLQHVDAGVQVVGIDEAQFLDERLPEVVRRLVEQGIRVIIAGLDVDYRGEPFGIVPHLMAVADRVSKLAAVCMCCGKPAVRSQLLITPPDGTDSGFPVIVGGDESYEARCRDCHSIPR